MFADDPERRAAYVQAATRVTHSDPRALVGAQAVASLCAWSIRAGVPARPAADEFMALLRACGTQEPEWSAIVDGMAGAVAEDWSVQAYADSLGLQNGITGYVYHTVPVVSYAWFRHFGDFEATLTALLDSVGDTDTTGAIAGALAGAVVGEEGIPRAWIDGIVDWPGVSLCYRLADQLFRASEAKRPIPGVRYPWPGATIRNVLFLLIVFAHGFRRLAPPY